MVKKFTNHNCTQCNYPIFDNVRNYSVRHYKFGLCKNCQDWFRDDKTTTQETKLLFLALINRNVPVELEKFDGHKTIDIAIPSQKINIEVDGSHHNTHSKQALSDLMRTYYSWEKGFLTFRIPNSIVKEHLNTVADFIVKTILISKSKTDREAILQSEVHGKKEFEELVTNFMLYFFHVFESDWGYTQPYITGLDNYGGLLNDSLDDANWQNRDTMIDFYRKMIHYMDTHGIFKRVFKKEVYQEDLLTDIFKDKYAL